MSGNLHRVNEMLDAMTPQEFDELVAFNEIEPIGASPVHRLLVFIAMILVNKDRGEKDNPITMSEIAEIVGLPKKQFEIQEETQYVSPEKASAMFRS